MSETRTIISAVNPCRFEDSYTEIWLKVWFEELDEPIVFLASPTDCERHGKDLWGRAMRGDFGPIRVIPGALDQLKQVIVIDDKPELLTHAGS